MANGQIYKPKTLFLRASEASREVNSQLHLSSRQARTNKP